VAGGAEPVQFVAVGISLAFGALGAGVQVGAQLIAPYLEEERLLAAAAALERAVPADGEVR